jgi:hypothetical protein
MSTPINDGGPAFPYFNPDTEVAYSGMSLRDWFAGQANEQDIKHHQQFVQYERAYGENPKPAEPKFTREQARYRYADTMLAERNTNTANQ